MFCHSFRHLQHIERKRIAMPENVTMRLNRGEQPERWSEGMQERMRILWPSDTVQQYPSYSQFYKRVAHHVGVDPDSICVGAGIEEFIRMLIMLCCNPHDAFAVTWPTCAMYEIYARAFNAHLLKLPADDPNNILTVDQILARLEAEEGLEHVRLLFLIQPGQPVETLYSMDDLEKAAKWCQAHDVVLAIDEAHWGFGALSAYHLVPLYPNIVVMRTFSKMFAGAALRVGYVMAQKEIMRALHAVRPSGEISGPSLHVATVLMDQYDNGGEVMQRAQAVAAGRDWLRNRINSWMPGHLTAYGEKGFSLLVDCQNSKYRDKIVSTLAQDGILVKGNFDPPLDRHFLMACGTKPLMERFWDKLRAADQLA